ncbi:adenylate/guanylate cyclase domain-containing protein [Humitalea sp. 24SJ18S-53]|uniref:adenylate/guanylate cyclase domain-containing protein n=1 Tax=Humitalea sp. 24SJ18S-53 TaxID=3422307 RepID=UPI003D6641C9
MIAAATTRLASSDTPVIDGRRRVAVAFADVVGYSTLMAVDENGTYARWMELLSALVEPQTRRHHGRIVDLAGDGVLAVFAAASDAVGWARAVQSGVRAGRPGGVGTDPVPIALRIGIHVGEVFANGDRIFGDTVNVAARLQTHASPGGIVLSAAVRAELDGALDAELRDIGHLELKGFERSARLYSIEADRVQAAIPLHTAGGLPSIAVLPLQDHDGDPESGYFADGIVADVVTSLAGLHELFVVSSASAAAFRGREPDPREAGRILGVRYLLQGSLRRTPQGLSISVQLCDVQTGGVLWGDRMQVPHGGLFAVQEDIVRKVVSGLAPNVRSAELRRAMRKRPESMTAYDRTLRGLHVIGSANRDVFESGRVFLAEAMAEEPGFALPIAWAARWHSVRVGRGWSAEPGRDGAEAMALAGRAVDLDRGNSLALATLGHLKSILLHDCDAAMECFDEALASCPNDAVAWTLSSGTLSYLGRGPDAVRHAEQGLRLSPRDPMRYAQLMFLGIAHYAKGGFEDAVRFTRQSAAENPLHGATLMVLAAALTAAGRQADAREVAHRYLALNPRFSVADYAETRQPFCDLALRAMFLGHLRQAGLPN